MELVSAIEEMIVDVPPETEGAGQAGADAVRARDLDRRLPERGRGGRPARGPAPAGARDGGEEGPDDRLRGHASVREVGGPADRRRASATTRSSTRSASSCARSCCSACTCTSASTIPRRRSTSRTACACTSRSCSRSRPTRPFWRGMPTGLMSTRTPIFRLLPRVGVPPRFDELGRLSVADRVHGRGRGGRGLHVPVVGRAAASEPRHGRDPLLRRPDPARAHDRARRR